MINRILLLIIFLFAGLFSLNAQCVDITTSNSLCTATSADFDLGPSGCPGGGTNYTWSLNQIMGGPNPTLTQTGDQTATIADLGTVTGDFALQVFIDQTGMGVDTTIIDTFTILASPIAEAGTTMEINCTNSQVTLDGTGSSTGGTISYLWTTSGGNIVSDETTLMPVVDMAGTYTLEVTEGANTCIATDDVVVTSDIAAPTASAGADMDIDCDNSSVVLDGSGSSMGGNFEYLWTTSGGNIVSGATTLAPIVDAAGTYILEVEDTDNGCTASDEVIVSLNTTPPTASAGPDMDLDCDNVTVVLDGSGSSMGANIEYLWTTSGGNIVSGATTQVPIVDMAGTYTLVVEDTDNGCTASDEVIVSINTTPPTADAGATMEIDCNNLMIALDGSGSSMGANFEYLWTTSGGNIVSDETTLAPIVDAAGTYILEVEDTDNGCTATSEVIVTIDVDAPTADAGPTMELDCNTTSVTLDGSGSSTGANFSYTWTTAGGNIVSGETTQMPVVDMAGTYTIFVLDSDNGCTASDQVIVTVDSAIPTASAGEDMELNCDNVQLFLDGSGSSMGGNYTYLWTASMGGNIVSGGTTLVPLINAAGTYTLEVTDINNSCVSTDVAEVTLDDNPPTANAGSDMELTCDNTQVFLDGSGSSMGGSFAYIWTASMGGNIVSGGTSLVPLVDAAGTYTLEVEDISNGCTSTDVVMVTEDMVAPTADAGPTMEIDCDNLTVTLDGSGSSSGGGFTYMWTASMGGNIVSGGTTLSPTVNMGGTYTLEVEDTGNGCTSTDAVMVTMSVMPPTADAGSDITINCANPTDNLDGSGSSSGGNIDYLWTASMGGNIVSGNTSVNPLVDAGGTYTLLVSNTDNGCTATDVVMVTGDFMPPNVGGGGPYGSVCQNDPDVMLNGSPTNSNGTWTGPNVTDNGNGTATFDPTGLVSDITVTYTYIDVPGNGCTNSVDEVINVRPIPMAGLTILDDEVCIGEDGIIIIENSQNGISYQLRLESNDSPVGAPVNGNGGDINITVSSPTIDTDYNVLATTPMNCSVEMVDKPSITVHDVPTITSAEASCEPDGTGTITITASIPTGTLEYSVNGVNYTDNPVIEGLGNDIYTVYVREVTTGCETTLGGVLVDCEAFCEFPPTSEAGEYDPVCADNPDIQLGGSVSNVDNFTWIGGNGNYNPNNTVLNPIYTPTASEIASGSVTLTLVTEDPDGAEPCQPASDETTIIILASPAISAGGPYPDLCTDADPLTITGFPTDGGGSWSIFPTPSGLMDLGNGTATIDPSDMEGQYTLTYSYTDGNGCTNDPATTTITVNLLPDFDIESSKGLIICDYDSTELSSDVANPFEYNYSWTLPDNSTSTEKSIFVNQAGQYNLTLEKDGCFATETFDLELSSVSAVLQIDPNVSTVCEGEEIELSISNASFIDWINPDAPDDQTSVDVFPTVSDFSYSAIARNGFGCELELSAEFEVFVPLPVTISIVPEQEFYCEGDEVTLMTNSGFITWAWDIGGNAQTNTIFTDAEVEEFNVDVVDMNECSNSNETPFEIDVREKPTIGIATQNDEEFTFTGGDDPFVFTAANETFDSECDGISTYTWFFRDANGTLLFNRIETENEFGIIFELEDTLIVTVELQILDECGCLSDIMSINFEVIEDGSCSASFSTPSTICLGDSERFVASPLAGSGGQPVVGYFIIDGIPIFDEGTYMGTNGNFEVTEVLDNTPFINFNGEIEVVFESPVEYKISYYYEFLSCARETSMRTIEVEKIPSLESIMVDGEACFGESPQISFGIGEEFEGKWNLDYTVEGEDVDSIKLQFNSPSNKLQFNNVEDDIYISYGTLRSVETGCSTEEYNSFEFLDTIFVFDELEYTLLDTCNANFDSIFYTINVMGGTGMYEIENMIQVDDDIFKSELLEAGSLNDYEIEDIDCDEEYIVEVEANKSCFTCFPLQEYIITNTIDVVDRIDICDNDEYLFQIGAEIEGDTLNKISQELLYVIQKENDDDYIESNALVVFNPTSVDGGFLIDINTIPDVELGKIYFLAVYPVAQTAQFLAPICESIGNIPIQFYGAPTAVIETSLEDDLTICKQEIDYQITNANNADISLWSSSDPDNVFFQEDAENNRVLTSFSTSVDGELKIYLNQENQYNSSGLLVSCYDIDSITLDVVQDKIAPVEDSIIWFPGDYLAYTDEGKCYEWGYLDASLNEVNLSDETTRFYIYDEAGEFEDKIFFVDVWECDDLTKECITRVFYNAAAPPLLQYMPDSDYKVNLYPNPNLGQFLLKLEGEQGGIFQVKMYNSIGILVSESEFTKEYTEHEEIFDTRHFVNGLYIIQVIDKGGLTKTIKMVKN